MARNQKINQELPIFKKIKNITITTEPLKKTTTQKVKRYEELKLNLRCFRGRTQKHPHKKKTKLKKIIYKRIKMEN